jgi:hypothetical protein
MVSEDPGQKIFRHLCRKRKIQVGLENVVKAIAKFFEGDDAQMTHTGIFRCSGFLGPH